MNQFPTVDFRGNYPGELSRQCVKFDEENESYSNNKEVKFSILDSTYTVNLPTSSNQERIKQKKAKRYYIQSTLEVNIDNQHPLSNIEAYREKIFPFVLTPNITIWSPKEEKTVKSRLTSIWKKLSNSEPSIYGILKEGGTAYSIPETIDLLLFISVCFFFIIFVTVYDASGDVRNAIYDNLSKQKFDLQPNLSSGCIGFVGENGVSSFENLYSTLFSDYITNSKKNLSDSIKESDIFPCGRGTVSDVVTKADYVRWIALILFPAFVDFRSNLNSPLITPVVMQLSFLDDEIPDISITETRAVLNKNTIYLYPYDTESIYKFFDKIIINENYFGNDKITGINTSFFTYNPFLGIESRVNFILEATSITGFFSSNLSINSLLVKTNKYSYIYFVLAFFVMFVSLVRIITHKDVLISPMKTIKSSLNRMFAVLGSLLFLVSSIAYISYFIPINWIWFQDSYLDSSKVENLNVSKLDTLFSEMNSHFAYLYTCVSLYRVTGCCSTIIMLWELFWFISIKFSRKHATSITVIVKKLVLPTLLGAAIGILLSICYGYVGLIILGHYSSIFSTFSSIMLHMLLIITGNCGFVWELLYRSNTYTGLFIIPLFIFFGIVFPSYIYALLCHLYNSTVDTVEWCWDNCSRNYSSKVLISPWYINYGEISKKNNQSFENENLEVNAIEKSNSEINELLTIRNRYSEFMAQSTTFERIYDMLFSKKRFFTKEQRKEIELSKYDAFEQVRKVKSEMDEQKNDKIQTKVSLNSSSGPLSLNSNNSQHSYKNLITKSIHEYYSSIFNFGKTAFSLPGTVSFSRGNAISTSQELMYRMVGTMESSVDITQSIHFKNKDDNNSNSIGLNDQNGLPLQVNNVMAKSSCPKMENLLTFTEKINSIGESIWFGVIIFIFLILLIISTILEYRMHLIGAHLNSISWNEFFNVINANVQKPIISSTESKYYDTVTLSKHITNSDSLSIYSSETPSKISLWISLAISKILYNYTSEIQTNTLFPNIDTNSEKPVIIFNQNLLLNLDKDPGVLFRAVVTSEERSLVNLYDGVVSENDLFKFFYTSSDKCSSYNDNDNKMINDFNMEYRNKKIMNFPGYYFKLIVPDNFLNTFNSLYEILSELLQYPKVIYFDVLLPALILKDQVINFVRISFTNNLTGSINKTPTNILIDVSRKNVSKYIKIAIEVAIFVFNIAYIVIFSLECKKFIKIYRNSPITSGRSARSTTFSFFNYILTDLSRIHDLFIILLIFARTCLYIVVFYYKFTLANSIISLSVFDKLYELTIGLSYLNIALIWLLVIRLIGPLTSISANFRFLIYSYSRCISPLFLTFLFMTFIFIGLIILVFVNFSLCNSKYSTFYEALTTVVDIFTGNFDYLEGYDCSPSLTIVVILPLFFAITYIVLPFNTIIILRGLWLSKKESDDVNRIFKIVTDSYNHRISEEYKKYMKNVTGMNTQISERDIWENVGIDYDEDNPIDRGKYEVKQEISTKHDDNSSKLAEISDEQWESSPDFIKEWAEYEAESFIDRFRNVEKEFRMATSSTGYYSKFVSEWEGNVFKELQLLEVTTNEAEQLLRRLQRAIRGTANKVRLSQALQTNNLEAVIREKEEEREAKRALIKARKKQIK
ncbi:hypothetical protein RS030_121985 [Cryptosporidium xiaoi]|uniref:Integral membrane protein n=1 Tax=Cryptosporidium xiaoi TaxID=659607 RepID=A0AAV9Y3N7_9CRYT